MKKISRHLHRQERCLSVLFSISLSHIFLIKDVNSTNILRNQRQDRTLILRLVGPLRIWLLRGRDMAFVSSLPLPYRLWDPPSLFPNNTYRGIASLRRGAERIPFSTELKNAYSHSSTVPYIVMACNGTTLLYLTPVQVLNKVSVELIRIISNLVTVLDEVHYSCRRLAPGCVPHCW
jgi:hypothetical protein